MIKRIDPSLRETVGEGFPVMQSRPVTGMVGEFPKLQGIVGREYARLQGEKPEVRRPSTSITFRVLPETGCRGTLWEISISIADKLDTIVGCFGVGLVPTGTADPFGLRRQALGIIRIVLEKKYPFSSGRIDRRKRKAVEGKNGASLPGR